MKFVRPYQILFVMYLFTNYSASPMPKQLNYVSQPLRMRTKSIANDVFFPQIRQLLEEGKEVAFTVKGNSMRPFLVNERDRVILTRPTTLHNGDIVLAQLQNGQFVLHRIETIYNGYIYLRGDGNIKGTEVCLTEKVIGKAIGFIRKNHLYPDTVNGLKWKCYSFLWTRLKPFRRWFLAFYDHLFKFI